MTQELLGAFDWTLALELVTKILLSLLLGGLVGLERERRKVPAGLRTFMLVSVGSCIFTIISYHGFIGGDPARVAAQIVSGIGFLGAGVTIHRKGTVYGLTSAAGIWAVAAVGMAVGTGLYFTAVFATLAIVIVLGLLRYWFKADVERTTRRTLQVTLHRVRSHIVRMGSLTRRALNDAVQAILDDDHELASRVIEGDAEINELRFQIEKECVEILRTHQTAKIEMRTVLAAGQIATNLERMGDYAKEIAGLRLQMGHERFAIPLEPLTELAERTTGLLDQALTAFIQDDVEAVQRISEEAASIDALHAEIVESVTEKMTEKKTRHFERGASLLTIAYDLKRVGDRAVNIAERVVFVRTGALEEIDPTE
jgi:phosphate transport system regulatory protein PhoU